MSVPVLPPGEEYLGLRLGGKDDAHAVAPRPARWERRRYDRADLAPARGIVAGLMLGCGAWAGFFVGAAASLRLL